LIAALVAFDPRTWGAILCAVAYSAGALLALRHFEMSLRSVSLLTACLTAAVWGGAQLTGTLWVSVAEVDLLRSGAWMVYFLACLHDRHVVLRWIRSNRSFAVLVALVLLTLPLVVTVLGGTKGIYNATVFIFLQMTISILTLFLLENVIRNFSGNAPVRSIIVYSAIGLMCVYDLIYGINRLMFPDRNSWLAINRGLALAAGAPFVALATLRTGVLQREFSLSRHAIFHSTVLVGIGLYLLVMSFAGEVLKLNEGRLGILIEIAFLAAGAISLMALLRSPSVRARFMVFIGKHFFRLKYDYREVWLNFIRRMAAPNARETLHDRTLHAIADAIQCGSGALWTFQHPLDTYVGTAQWNIESALPMIPAGGQFTEFLIETSWVVDIEQCLNDPDAYTGLRLPRWIERETSLWVVVPLIHNRVLEGFVALGNPHSRPSSLTWEEFDLLKTVGAQAAGYLAEDRASRELDDARRLGEFNRRFAFVIHDIKNVVGQMSMMLKNAERFGDDPQFQRDMLETAGSAVERLRGMLTHLGNKPQTRRTEPEPVDIEALSGAVGERWQRLHGGISFEGPGHPVTVMAVADKVVSVLDHLIQNAVDAAGPGGCVKVVVANGGDDGIIEIIDSGPGMTSDFVRSQLFRPFETSKPDGSGLGAFQALRMVREMGGNLDVETESGKGTVMRVRLPKEAFLSALTEEASRAARSR